MSGLPVVLGLVLGAGVVLVWQGLRILSDTARAEEGRRRGFWRLNTGLMLIAVSVIAFLRSAGG